jgi:hypothetical protein
MIKKYWAYLLLFFAIIFFIYKSVLKQNESIQVQPFSIKKGWGYDIYKDKKIYIHQEIIPAVEGRKNFVSKIEAEKVGELVVSKMKAAKGVGFPQITIQELDSLQITK